ncbi:MAG: hypothetical protein ACR2PI_25350 [Hyphomicrobiaceae bacterium]
MIRTFFAALFLMTVAVGVSHAADCSKYRFGSQEWWQCQNQFGPD